MSDSNISLQSNIQPININKKYDKDFLYKIHNLAALNKLRFSISSTGSMNTREFMFKRFQADIVTNTGYGGYLNRDQCWGPVRDKSGNIVLANKPLETAELIKYFDPKDESAVEKYGYNKFIESATNLYDVIINGGSYGDDEYDSRCIVQPNDPVSVDLTKLSAKISLIEPKKQEEKSTDDRQSYAKVNAENVYALFEESTQKEIIEASEDDVIFVDAGPGTGKTYTLINRINHLVTNREVNPEGILVLCFTNATVDEIKDRLKRFVEMGADRGLANVDIRTFHSFAWWLIGQANELFCDDGWQKVSMTGMDYDASLKVASRIVVKFQRDILGNWEHFIVDEVQDLTNTLARFVLRIVNACKANNCGFTLLGDACQAIYDYLQDDDGTALRSDEFYMTLYAQIKDRARLLKLTKNHRQTDRLIADTSVLREAILSQEHVRMEDATNHLLKKIIDLEKAGISIKKEDLDTWRKGGKICLLLRNNGQTLRLSSDLRKHGIEHVLNSKKTDRNFASWIADVFADYDSKYIDYDDFERLIGKNDILKEYSAEDIWNKICSLLSAKYDDLRVKDIIESIMYSRIDDAILRVHDRGNIIVSNIHRAKGREYDTVIVDRCFVESMTDEKANVTEYKTLYVAVTRPKDQLYFSPLQKKNDLVKIEIFDTGRSRWGKYNKRQIKYLEFDSTVDLDINNFAFINQSNFNDVKVDDDVFLRRKIHKNKISYEIIHEDTSLRLGTVSNAYIDDIMHYMRIDSSKLFEMPDEIHNLNISGVYTQIVDQDFLNEHPEIAAVAKNGIWKWVELSGLGHFQYGVY